MLARRSASSRNSNSDFPRRLNIQTRSTPAIVVSTSSPRGKAGTRIFLGCSDTNGRFEHEHEYDGGCRLLRRGCEHKTNSLCTAVAVIRTRIRFPPHPPASHSAPAHGKHSTCLGIRRATGILCRALRVASLGPGVDHSLVFHEFAPMAAARPNEKTHDLRGGVQTSANCRCGQRSRGGIRRWRGSNRSGVLFPAFGGLPSSASH